MPLAKAGIQLIVFRRREREDLEGVLKDCKKAGYESIETDFLFDKYSPGQLREACGKYQLEYAAIHGGFNSFLEEKSVDRLIENTLAVGAKYLICSGVGEGKGLDRFRRAALLFNRVAKKCKGAYLTFCYHNHSSEFEEFDGTKGIDILGEETDPELVEFNIDVAWVYIGGENPSDFIERYKDRCGYYHFKDALVKGKNTIIWKELGKGEVDLKSAYEAAMRWGTDYIIYEQDSVQISVLEAITESRGFLKSLGI